MTYYVENETDMNFSFSEEEIVGRVMEEVLTEENCPYAGQVNVLLTDNEGIRQYNREYRNMDRPTNVLSFHNLDFDAPSNFSIPKERIADYFDPESEELLLGDIIVSVDKVQEQAAAYGHSTRREFAFLIAHSMLHLCGYDHMTEKEAAVMETKQEHVLQQIGITREK